MSKENQGFKKRYSQGRMGVVISVLLMLFINSLLVEVNFKILFLGGLGQYLISSSILIRLIEKSNQKKDNQEPNDFVTGFFINVFVNIVLTALGILLLNQLSEYL
tara:strand:+ start:88 stop:402 length:315 start_codon:yes stop_codon:yes gene_type:complete